MGTGSGAVILSVASRFPDSEWFAVDISTDALEVARKNAETNRIPVEFVQGDLLAPFFDANGLAKIAGKYVLILANLPYVGPGEDVGEDVVAEDPAIALYGGGERGFDLIVRLLGESLRLAESCKGMRLALEF